MCVPKLGVVFSLLVLAHCSPMNLLTLEDPPDSEEFYEEEPFVEADIVIGSQTIPLVDFRVS